MAFMLRRIAAIIFVLALAPLAFSPAALAQKNTAPPVRTITGVVTDGSGAPINGAVVQLENTKTLLIRSYIVKEDGIYTFNDLSMDVDYQLSAMANGHRSGTKIVSSFDSKPLVRVNLQIK
jgi:hypothetical protein